MKKNEVSVELLIVLVNYNSYKHTKECIDSIMNQTYKKFKIYIIDNNSNAVDREQIKLLKDNNIVVIISKYNRGFAAGNNLGLLYALKNQIPYVLLLNNDTVCEGDFLQKIIRKAKDNCTCVVCPKINNYYIRNQIMYAGGEIVQYKGGVKIYGVNKNSPKFNKDKWISFAHGCCMLLPLEIITQIGTLPEHYFLYFEDTAYSKKIQEGGYKILYAGNIEIYHKESMSTDKLSDNYQYYMVRNRLMFINEYIDFIYKPIAYIYTSMYIFKKIYRKIFSIKNCSVAILDFCKGKNGERKNEFCDDIS